MDEDGVASDLNMVTHSPRFQSMCNMHAPCQTRCASLRFSHMCMTQKSPARTEASKSCSRICHCCMEWGCPSRGLLAMSSSVKHSQLDLTSRHDCCCLTLARLQFWPFMTSTARCLEMSNAGKSAAYAAPAAAATPAAAADAAAANGTMSTYVCTDAVHKHA